jgi:hypothetical protein
MTSPRPSGSQSIVRCAMSDHLTVAVEIRPRRSRPCPSEPTSGGHRANVATGLRDPSSSRLTSRTEPTRLAAGSKPRRALLRAGSPGKEPAERAEAGSDRRGNESDADLTRHHGPDEATGARRGAAGTDDGETPRSSNLPYLDATAARSWPRFALASGRRRSAPERMLAGDAGTPREPGRSVGDLDEAVEMAVLGRRVGLDRRDGT